MFVHCGLRRPRFSAMPLGCSPHRGRGHINELLAGATRLLLDHKLPGVTADTDQNNVPMAAAFIRAGYESESPARYFQVRLTGLGRSSRAQPPLA